MIPSRSAAPIVIFASLALAACASAPPADAPPQPQEAPPSLFGPSGRGTSPVDQQMLAIAKSEEEIDKLFPHAANPPSLPHKRSSRSDGDKPKEPRVCELKDSNGAALSAGDACAVACRALDSMRTSADHLCKLAGEGDGRCEDARGRVRGASQRVRAVCPECGSAAK